MTDPKKPGRSRRTFSFTPSLELLETRLQPGSVLSAAPDSGAADLGLDDDRRALRRSKTSGEQPRKRPTAAESAPPERSIKAKEKAKQDSIVTPQQNTQKPSTPTPPIASNTSKPADPPPSAPQSRGTASQGSVVTSPPRNTSPPQPTSSLLMAPARDTDQQLPPALGAATTGNASRATTANHAAEMDSIGVAHSTAVRTDRTVANPNVKQLGSSEPAAAGPDALTSWSSFLGSAHVDMLRPITVGPDGLYTGGFITDPANPGVTDMLIAKVSVDGSTLLNAVALNFPGGTFAELKGIDVDSEGNMYAIGVSNFQGFLARIYFRLDADWQTISWTIASSVPSEGNDIFHDDRTYTIYVTGTTDARSIGFPEQSMQVSWFSDLANTAGPTSIFGYVYTYDGFDGATANALGVGPDFKIQVAGTFLKGTDIYAAQHEISADGEVANGVYFDTAGFGSLNDIYVDRNGDAFGVGYIPSGLGDGRRDLLLTKVNPGLAVEYAYSFGGNDVDLNGWGITLDGAGQIYVAGSIGLDGDFDVLVAKFSADGTMMTDAVMTGGLADELALSIDYDPATDAVYTVGYTISTEFETTRESFQPIFGGLMDGFIMRVEDFI